MKHVFYEVLDCLVLVLLVRRELLNDGFENETENDMNMTN